MRIVDFEDTTGVAEMQGQKAPMRKDEDGFTMCFRGSLLERIAFVLTGRMYLQLRHNELPELGLSYEIEK